LRPHVTALVNLHWQIQSNTGEVPFFILNIGHTEILAATVTIFTITLALPEANSCINKLPGFMSAGWNQGRRFCAVW
jgi:hypothetical protein